MAGPDPPDFEKLEEYFRALSYSTRLQLLYQLRFPRALPDIRLTPNRVQAGLNPERTMSRQSIEEHLQKLVEIGVVTVQETSGARGRREYVVSGPRLYQIMEEFRQVGTVLASSAGARDETAEMGQQRPPAAVEGPHLVLAHGLIEGKPFPLRRADLKGTRGWAIGRKVGLHVSLEYDPYVSLENAEIVPDGDRYVLLDLRSSRNGTWHNWRKIGADERVPLQPGDAIGVGRSLLIFRR